jgi:hypothetical protein
MRDVHPTHLGGSRNRADAAQTIAEHPGIRFPRSKSSTMTGWICASERGWSISLFFATPLPTLPIEGSLLVRSIGNWHGTMEWALLVIGAHVAAAMAHRFIFRDQIMQRMPPEKPMLVRTRKL